MIVNIYLLLGALQDTRERRIKNSYLKIGEVGSMIHRGVHLILGISSLSEWVYGLIPGLLLIIIAKLTEEKIGYGDGILLLILGNFMYFTEVWKLLQTAFLFVMIFSILLVISKKGDRKCEIPFLPFLWMSHTLLWGLGNG